MFPSIKSANYNNHPTNNKNSKPMTTGNQCPQNHPHQTQLTNNHHPPHNNHNASKSNQSKKSSTISLNINDTNDIRYSQSNTQLQLQRLSLSASLIEIYFGKHYRSPDVLVVSGFLLILIGLGAILISVYVYFNEHEFQEMTFLGGSAMMAIGFICCSCRIILFGPHLFNCCPTIKSSTHPNYHNQRRPTNPPFFTAASTAMSTVTCIGVRFNSSRTISGQSHVGHVVSSSNSQKLDSPSVADLSITSIHGDSLESIETIKDETIGPPHNQQPTTRTTINPPVLHQSSILGSKS